MIDTNICKYYQMYYWMYHIDVVYVLLNWLMTFMILCEAFAPDLASVAPMEGKAM